MVQDDIISRRRHFARKKIKKCTMVVNNDWTGMMDVGNWIEWGDRPRGIEIRCFQPLYNKEPSIFIAIFLEIAFFSFYELKNRHSSGSIFGR